MANVDRPILLDFVEALADAASHDFAPPAGESWEVHSVVISAGPVELQRVFDPDESGALGDPVAVKTLSTPGEVHAAKFELDGGASNPTAALRVLNNSGGTLNAYVLGVVIS